MILLVSVSSGWPSIHVTSIVKTWPASIILPSIVLVTTGVLNPAPIDVDGTIQEGTSEVLLP